LKVGYLTVVTVTSFRHNRHKSNIKTRKSFWCCRNFTQNFNQYLLYFELNTYRSFTTTSV